MRLLLDTQLFIWFVADSMRLTKRARKQIDAAEEVLVSAASIWEIGIKTALGKLEVNLDDVVAAIEASGFVELPVRAVRRRLAKKTSVEGRRARVEVLRRAGVRARELELWTHDALDAAVASLTAQRANAGRAREITCGRHGSAIWVP